MLGGCKSEIGREGGCLCTISLNKAVVVRAPAQEHQGPLAEREEMLESLPSFTSATAGCVKLILYQLCYSVRDRLAEAVRVVRNLGLEGYMF